MRPPPAAGTGSASRVRRALLAASGFWCLSVSVLYAVRPAFAEAVIFAPPWLWAIPGLLLAGLGLSRATRHDCLGAAAVWTAYLLVNTESLATLLPLRSWPSSRWEAQRRVGTAIRVVSLNCAGGSAEAAAEVIAYDPDIVLLQESPGRPDVEALTRQLFGEGGECVVGLDTSIAARGILEAADLPPALRRYFVQAGVRLSSGIATEVISLRLMPGAARVDLWSPDCWRQQTASHLSRVDELVEVARRLDSVPEGVPVIVGGDFNAPAGDALYRLLPARLTDSLREGGVGWGETMMNDLPVLRFDQIWVSGGFATAGVVARRTRHSDHRVVVCDLMVRAGGSGVGR